MRRIVVGIVATPFLVAISMTLIDSYRRRGKHRAVAFRTGPPSTVPVGDGEVTTYTFGTDLYDDMIAAIDGADRQILFETYIWKSDEVGHRFRSALEAAAGRGVEVYLIYDAFANLVVSPRFKHFPAPIKVLRYPVYAAGWRPFDLRRYGRDHRKILVVDESIGFVGGYNIGAAYATEWRDTHVRITGPGVWDLKRAFADFWNLNRRQAPAGQRATAPPGDGIDVGADDPLPPQRAPTLDVPHPVDVHGGHRPRQHEHLDDDGLLPAGPRLRQRPDGRCEARGRRPCAHPGQVQPRGLRLDLARLLQPAAGRRREGAALPRRDGARQDRHHRRHLDDGRHGEHRPAQPDRQLRDQRRDHRPRPGRLAGGDLPDRRVELPRADQCGVGGARHLPPLHRVRAQPPAPACCSASDRVNAPAGGCEEPSADRGADGRRPGRG